MSTALSLRLIKFADGERFPLLIDEAGIPHWHATLFVTAQVRNASRAPNTMAAVLTAVRSLLKWAESSGIDLEERFAGREFLATFEIESLRAHMESRHVFSKKEVLSERALIAGRRESARAAPAPVVDRLATTTRYIRMTYAADYLEWLAVRLVERAARHVDAATLTGIKAMVEGVRKRRPQKGVKSLLNARRGLPEDAQARLLSLVQPDFPENPFEPEARRRNELIVLLLFHLGIRAGELLALKVTDFDFQRNEVVVARRHGDATDPRLNQPVVKTLDRRIPLQDALASAVSRYVLGERHQLAAARKHEFLLVTHKVGPFLGQPLSMKGLSKLFAKIQEVEPTLLGSLSPHVLRHTANDRFSALMDKNNVSAPKEEKMRSYVMGWKEGSGTASTYTRRHIEKEAKEVFLRMQESAATRNSRDKK